MSTIEAIPLSKARKLLFPDSIFKRIRPLFALERCALTGSLLVLAGLGAAFYALLYWYSRSFGRIDDDALIKVVCAASFLIALGFQLVFSSFFIYLVDQDNIAAPSSNPNRGSP